MDWWSVESFCFCSAPFAAEGLGLQNAFLLRWWIIWSLSEMWQLSRAEEGSKIDSSALICIFTFREAHLIYFFRLPIKRHPASPSCRRRCVELWKLQDSELNASHHRAAPLSEDNTYGNCNFGADGDSEWGFIGRFLHVSSGPVLMTQGAFRVLFLLMLGCV